MYVGGGGVVRGSSNLSPPYMDSESPKYVLTECYMFCRVVKVHLVGSLGGCWLFVGSEIL